MFSDTLNFISFPHSEVRFRARSSALQGIVYTVYVTYSLIQSAVKLQQLFPVTSNGSSC